MTETEDTDFGRELIASMQEAVAIVKGDKDAARVHIPLGTWMCALSGNTWA